MSPNRVETAMFGWFDEVHGGMEVDSKYFAQRSELFHTLVRDDVTSFDSMLLHLIAYSIHFSLQSSFLTISLLCAETAVLRLDPQVTV